MEKINTSIIIDFIKKNLDNATCYSLCNMPNRYIISIKKEGEIDFSFKITHEPSDNNLTFDFLEVIYTHNTKEYNIILTPEAINSIDVRLTEGIETLLFGNFLKIKERTMKQDAIKALYAIEKIIRDVEIKKVK